MKRYFVIEVITMTVVNTILWDGITDYEVGDDYELVEVTEENIALYLPPSEGND
jgi:hypothetical protein